MPERHVEVGRALLRESLYAAGAGPDVVEARVNPAFHSFAREREEALTAAGYELAQTKRRLSAEPRTQQTVTCASGRADLGSPCSPTPSGA